MWNISQVIFCLTGAGSDMMWRINACWADAVGWCQYSNEGKGCKSMLEGNQDAAGLQFVACEVAWRHLVTWRQHSVVEQTCFVRWRQAR